MANLAISGWSGVGSTSVTLVLALELGRRYVYIGSVFRYLGEKLGYGDEGMDRIEADLLLERKIGRLMDRYTDWVLLNEKNIILESDLAGFRLGKTKDFFSVFIKGSLEQRSKRVINDMRGDEARRLLSARDEVHKELYGELWGIDYFDEKLISDKYWEVVDSGNLSMRQTIELIRKMISKWPEFELQNNKVDKWMEVFEKDGKNGLRKILAERKLMVGQEEIFSHLRENFRPEVEALPIEISKWIMVE